MRRIRLISAWRVWERNFAVYRKRWMYSLVPNFFEPVFYLLGMGIGLGVYVGGGGAMKGSYVTFIAPGLAAASAMNGACFETTYNVFVKMQFAKIYDAMIATRLSMEDVVVGEIMWAVTRSFVYGGIFSVVTLFFGIRPGLRLMLVVPVLLLIGLCFAGVGMAFTSVIESIDLYTYFFTMFLTPSFLFSGIFFPIRDRFPAALVTFARCTPLYQAVQLMRAVMRPGSEAVAPVWSVLYLLLVGLGLCWFAVYRLSRRMVC